MADDRWMWWATPPRSFPASEFTTADEMRQERISQALGWDTTQPSARFRETLVRHLPAMLGFIGPRAFVAPRVAPGGQAPPPPQMRLNTETWGYEPVAQPQLGAPTAVPSSGPQTSRPSLSHPEQLTPHIFDRYGLREPVRPQGPWDPGPTRPNSPTQGQRDYHAMDPRNLNDLTEAGAIDMSARRSSTPLGYYREDTYLDALRNFEKLSRPPNNRLNALLPFVGAAGGFAPDEPY